MRAVLPCEVRVLSERHPLFGQVLSAKSFKRWAGRLLLVVTLPDGSPGTVPAEDTGVFGDAGGVSAWQVVLDAAGVRELRRLLAVAGRGTSGGVGGSGPKPRRQRSVRT
ncbi:MAG: hypothetical protein IPG94_21245 [Kineosporiaceae bacterium]|nr:hypothetical protein [Kineosporiaceae bacterium]